METIFDHNVTDEELKELGRYPTTKEEYVEGLTEHSAFTDIADLYFIREDEVRGEEYQNKAGTVPMYGINDYLDFDE